MIMLDLDDFITRAFLAGIGIALSTGVLGCFVVWRKMAYLGDSLAHSSLLGVVIGVSIGLHPTLSIVLYGFVFALILILMQRNRLLAIDTLLGVIGHSSLAIGIVAISLSSFNTVSLHSYLLGDILAVNRSELIQIYVAAVLVIASIAAFWSPLLLTTVSEDLALAERVKTFWLNALLILLIAIVVAISIRIMGILLTTALLIMPAASARYLCKTPESMLIFSVLISILSVLSGLFLSFQIDIPSGPSIVMMSMILFISTLLFKSLRTRLS